jgi:hypothetical protein
MWLKESVFFNHVNASVRNGTSIYASAISSTLPNVTRALIILIYTILSAIGRMATLLTTCA